MPYLYLKPSGLKISIVVLQTKFYINKNKTPSDIIIIRRDIRCMSRLMMMVQM
jgi:hypothetical protein